MQIKKQFQQEYIGINMFIEITDVYKKVLLFRLDDLNFIEKRDDGQFDLHIEGLEDSVLVDDRGYQKIRNKFKEKDLLI